MSLVRFVDIPQKSNDSGSLVVAESGINIPFEIQRVYCLIDLANDAKRGFHAHKALEQVAICLHGSCRFVLDDGKEREDIVLDRADRGLYIGNMIWREMHDFSPNCVLMVLASQHYDDDDYIRNYEDFKGALAAR